MRLSRIAVAIVALAVTLPGIAVAGDREMAQKIANELKESGALVQYNIGVKYQDGTAWLSGQVRSEEQLEAALEIIGAMDEVDHVINDIEIVAPAKSPATEKTAATKKTAARKAKQTIARQASAEEEMPLPLEKKASTSRKRGAGKPASYQAEEAPQAFSPADAREVPEAYYGGGATGAPMPVGMMGGGAAPVSYDQPNMPNYAWPSYAAYPNYAGVTYPKQYSPTAWPYIGPFYPYPQVPLGWRKVTLEWDDGWWFLDFDDVNQQHARRW